MKNEMNKDGRDFFLTKGISEIFSLFVHEYFKQNLIQ